MTTELNTMFYEVEDSIAWVTFNRPHVLHAMSNETMIELGQIADRFAADPKLRIVVFTGSGRSFSTGIDLKQLAAEQIEMDYHEHFEYALRVLETMNKVVIAGINGWCLGGGLQLALACDLRVCSDAATIGLPAIKECLIPGLSTFRLPQYIGMGRAKRLILTGENIDAAEAYRIGLVDYLVPAADFDARLKEITRNVRRACSEGTRQSKMLIPKSLDLDRDAFYEAYMIAQEVASTSPDAEEARRAYLEDRDPIYE